MGLQPALPLRSEAGFAARAQTAPHPWCFSPIICRKQRFVRMAGATGIGATRIWIGPLVGAALIFGGVRAAYTQSSHTRFLPAQSRIPGSLTGKLTTLDSQPLAGVTVILRNESTGAEFRTTTHKNGTYRFTGLDAGEYTLEADSPRLGRGRLDGIVIYDGCKARMQAAMSFEPLAPAPPASAPLTPVPLQAVREPAPQPVRSVAPASPALASSLPPQPLRALPLPAAAAPLTAALPSEPQRLQPLPGQSTRGSGLGHAGAPAAVHVKTAASPSPGNAQSAMQGAIQSRSPAKMRQLAALNPAAAPKAVPAGPPEHAPPPATGAALSIAASVAAGRAALVAVPVTPPHRVAIQTAAQQTNPVTPAVASTVTAAELHALPVSGRRWEEFVLDSPTASAPADSSHAAMRGAGQEQAETTIDGANTRVAFGSVAGSPSSARQQRGTGQYEMGQTWKGGNGLAIGESAVRQVKIVDGNTEAKGMYAAGGLTEVETERGENQLHGQSFFFDQQNIWGAQNPFTSWLQNTGTAAAPVFNSVPYTPPDHETNWGIGVGSRIRRNKIFWFAALDGSQRNDPGLPMAKHPIAPFVESDGSTLCVGFFCPPSALQTQLLCAQLGLSIPNPAGGASSCPTAAVTAGYNQVLESLAGLLGPAPRTSALKTGFGRIDWKLSERQTIAIEGNGANLNAPGGGFTRVPEDYGSHSFGSSDASQEWLLARWEAFLTPNLLAVSQFSAGRTIFTAPPDTPSAFEEQFMNGNTRLPQIVVDSRDGFTIGNPSRFGPGSYPDERLYDAQEMLDWVHGNLLVKAGFEVDHSYDQTSLLRNGAGTYHYSKVQNFISDALAYLKFGPNPSGWQNTPAGPTVVDHNCDASGGPSYGANDQLLGLGAMPCYSFFSQMMGPTTWHLGANDWAGYASAQWEPSKNAVFSFGLLWQREQLPPPIAALDNPQLPFTEKLPDLGNNWGPHLSLAVGPRRGHWPVLRLGYGMYYGRVENATVETALTQTGSLKGDQYFFFLPTQGYTSVDGTSTAPFFPNELEGPPGSVVMPGAVGFAPNFRNPEVHQAVASVEEVLPGRVRVSASALLSLGRRLPVAIDTNLDSPSATQTITYNVCDEAPYSAPGANVNGQPTNVNGKCASTGMGPIKATQITIPFYASWPGSAGPCRYYTPTATSFLQFLGRPCPDYQAITQIISKANSTYEAAVVKLTRYGRRGLSFNAYYTYAHAMDWNPVGVTLGPENDVLDPADFRVEYGTSDLDVRHSATAMLAYEPPWRLRGLRGRIGNAWMLSGIGEFHSGLPYSMRISGSVPEEFTGTGAVITGLGASMNGSGGDNRYFGLPRNSYRYPNMWRADLRLGKGFDLGAMRRLELFAESFNLFNHQNVTAIETTGYDLEPGQVQSSGNGSTGGGSATNPSLTFLTGLYRSPKTGIWSPAFSEPLAINGDTFYRERQIELGLRMTF